MSGQRSSHALARIEAALARIESAAQRESNAENSEDLVQLQARHEALRAAVTDSLGQLDQLIEGAQG